MYGQPMQFRDLAPVVGGTPTRAAVREAKARGELIERRPHAEPGRSGRRHAVYQTVAAEQPLPLAGEPAPVPVFDGNPNRTPCGCYLRIGAEDI